MVNFENGVTPINDVNLNKIQTDLQKEIRGTILYEDATGTTDTITLTDEIENYDYFEIESYVIYNDIKVYVNTGKLPLDAKSRIHINNLFIGAGGELTVYNKRLSISSKSLTVNSDRLLNNSGMTDGNYTYITKITGYKEA